MRRHAEESITIKFSSLIFSSFGCPARLMTPMLDTGTRLLTALMEIECTGALDACVGLRLQSTERRQPAWEATIDVYVILYARIKIR